MKKINYTISLVISLVIVAILAKLNYLRYFHMAGDSAGYVDLLRRIYNYNDMRSNVFAAAYPIFDLIQDSATICSSSLTNTYENNSFFRWHAYVAAFLIAKIGGLFTGDFVEIAAVVNALNTYAIFLFALLIAKSKKLNWLEILLFGCILISFAPLVGSISGQYYFDRLFISLALFYCYLHLENKRPYHFVVSIVVIVFTSMVSERSALMIGLLACYLAMFGVKQNKGYRFTTFLFGLAAITYYILWVKYYQNSVYNGSTNLQTIIANLHTILDWSSPLSVMTRQWLVILAPLLVLSFFSRRYILLVLIFLAPNLLISVGGAEKTGFVTHYHSYYIPILIFGAIIGYSNIKKYISNNKYCYAILGIVLALNLINMHDRVFVVSPTLTHTFYGDLALLLDESELNKTSQKRANEINQLLLLIDDPKSSISASEFAMPIMVSRNMTRLRLLPIGIGDSEYLLLESAVGQDDSHIILPLYAADPIDLNRIVQCIYARVSRGYSKVGTKQFQGINYTLYKANR